MQLQILNEFGLIDNQDMRERFIGRIDVLNKVKELFVIPKMEVMTTKMVAEYFEVDEEVIKKCYQRNKNEIDSDGVIQKKLVDMRDSQYGHDVHIVKEQRKITLFFSGVTIDVPNTGLKVFPLRAILRIAMLLRDSEIANEIRTQLLNTFEHATEEQRSIEIDNEQGLINKIGRAFMGGDINEFAKAAQEYVAYQNRHISKLQDENTILSIDNKLLMDGILQWNERSSLNKAVRILATMSRKEFWKMWRELYDELRYKHGMHLSNRGSKPYIKHIREDEWSNVIKSFSAISVNNGCNPSKILMRAKLNDESTFG